MAARRRETEPIGGWTISCGDGRGSPARRVLFIAGSNCDPPLELASVRAPFAFDELKGGSHLIRSQALVKGRHLRVQGRVAAVGDDLQQEAVRVVPGMAAGIVRRRRKRSVRQGPLPVRCALQIRSMAGATTCCVKFRAAGDPLRIKAWHGWHRCPADHHGLESKSGPQQQNRGGGQEDKQRSRKDESQPSHECFPARRERLSHSGGRIKCPGGAARPVGRSAP